MSSFQDNINEKVIPMILKFVNLKGVIALKDGLMCTLPLTMAGSIFLLLACIPYQPLNDWLSITLGAGWTDPLWKAFGATFNIIALMGTMGMAYTYTKNEGYEPLPAGIIACVVFVLTIRTSITTKGGETIGDVIPMAWTGGKGMIAAIVIGLIVGAVYSWFMKKNIIIKMPEGVPQGVSSAFAALIPSVAIILGATVVYAIFNWGLQTTLVEWIYKVIQTPLQGMSDSMGGIIVIGFAMPFLWWFGVHGSTIVGGIVGSLLGSNALDNAAIVASGKELTIANGAHIVTSQFTDNFLTFTGCGITIGLVLSMLLAGKSAQSKTLGKLAIVPALFNINEPVLFGFPIVMNPFMFLPFVAVPTITAISTYLAIKVGFLHPFSGVSLPWTTPPIISGFILQGWKGALWQILIMAMATAIYFPFFKKQESINLKAEQEADQ
ncbi:PTS system cellobiose-specific IIC component [Clostridium saccharoperbutylacetonicum]|uniref:Permease IIC component n=1 Tax=Clostridium saccharoperbutylacetonicum N1-4(HMT) TaxID=931276 RepID=M1LRF3_9CLOT|nr:PTS sugar transporter subunit IIC [Clostridium saccharoperbutylacetonicum]AGF55515.1 PTS system, lactose/cellobiose family IIC component [Clostridium saccharoperbutylacetonicum N1-4(HMT)]NRT63766.1 PTS system cellobiose-specific IIC component [Clostridium saccharoperbutylacetonicum]NSB27129.1 PTS system cellobiose-specific IIC component [Clostridium saccharoperbutylacetonicum]NSB40615.1 PTS system cellobiose-specific IIC component [Clostridium saccharoperbutylacetonicum]